MSATEQLEYLRLLHSEVEQVEALIVEDLVRKVATVRQFHK